MSLFKWNVPFYVSFTYDTTHSYVQHDPFTCVTWLSLLRDKTYSMSLFKWNVSKETGNDHARFCSFPKRWDPTRQSQSESCIIVPCDWVMAHKWMSHGTYMNESCHTWEWVMAETCMIVPGLFLNVLFEKRHWISRTLHSDCHFEIQNMETLIHSDDHFECHFLLERAVPPLPGVQCANARQITSKGREREKRRERERESARACARANMRQCVCVCERERNTERKR